MFATQAFAQQKPYAMQYIGFASFGAGDVIFKQGDTGEHFYIILSGAVDVSVYTNEETKVRRLTLSTLLYADSQHNMSAADAAL